MKTNVTLMSSDRRLFGSIIRHRTKPDMLCLTDLQDVYNKLQVRNSWDVRSIQNILNIKLAPENAERLYYVLKERGLIDSRILEFMEECHKLTLIKVLKNKGLYKMYGRGDKRIIFASPDIFVLAALEFNPQLYAKTIVWLTDNLIYNRIGVGDENNMLMQRINHNWNPDGEFYKHVQRALNYIIFNRHETGIRNEASSEELRLLEKLQNNYAFAIDTGFVNDKEDLLLQLRQEYLKKWMSGDNRIKSKLQIR